MENIITDKLLFDKKVFSEKLKKSSNPLSIFKEALNNGYEYLTSNFIPGENIDRYSIYFRVLFCMRHMVLQLMQSLSLAQNM